MATIKTTSNDYQNIERVASKFLCHGMVHNHKMDKFAKLVELPENAGTKTMRIFIPGEANVNNVRLLEEGVKPATPSSRGRIPVDLTLQQHGDWSEFSDTMTKIDLLNLAVEESKIMATEAAMNYDNLCRNALVQGQDQTAQKLYSGADSFDALGKATASNALLSIMDLKTAKYILRTNKTPTINGDYIALVSPEVALDISNNEEWKSVREYQNQKAIYEGELGKMYGIRIIEIDDGYLESADKGEGVYNAAGNIVSTMVIGVDAYSALKFKGTSSHMKPQMMICNQASKDDPLNQVTTIGWKCWLNAAITNKKNSVIIRSRSTIKE